MDSLALAIDYTDGTRDYRGYVTGGHTAPYTLWDHQAREVATITFKGTSFTARTHSGTEYFSDNLQRVARTTLIVTQFPEHPVTWWTHKHAVAPNRYCA